MGLGEEARAGAFAPQPEATVEDPPVVEQTEDEAAAQAEQHRIAKFNAHPHTRLTNLQKQLVAPGQALDAPGRIATLHSVIGQLVQIIKEHTPAPGER